MKSRPPLPPRRPAPEASYPRSPGPVPCATWPTNELFTAAIEYPDENRAVWAARAHCVTCPAVQACGTYAVSYDVPGVWGGLSEAERKKIRRGLRWSPRMPPSYATQGALT